MHSSAMSFLKLTVAASLSLALLPASGAWAGPPEGAKASAKVKKCHSSSKSKRRSLELHGRMSTPGRDVEMRMKFRLRERTPVESWRDVTPESLQEWLVKPPGIDVFKSRFKIRNLSAPARYRGVVNFEWYRDGVLIGKARRSTGSCRQKSKQPDLAARYIMIRFGTDEQTWKYVFRVTNIGKRDARDFRLVVKIGEAEIASKTVGLLRRGESVKFEPVARRCSGNPMSGVVDPDDNVSEGNEMNNSVKVDCPQ